MDQNVRDQVVGKVQRRTVSLDRASVKAEERTVELSFSSESPVERWFGMEILDHAASSVRMGRMMDGAPLLFGHDPEKHLGVIESARIDGDRIGRAVVRFSRSAAAEDKFRDVLDGILTKVSVGYMVHEMALDRKEGETSFYRCTDWEPIEVSMVTIPADNSVGVGRTHTSTTQPQREGNQMSEPTKDLAAPPAEKKQEDVLREDRERTQAINVMTAKYADRVKNISELRDKAISEGWSVEKFRGACYDRIEDGKPVDTPESSLGLSKKEKQSYSFRKAVAHLAGLRGIDAGFEIECSRAIADKLGIRPKGLLVPYDVQGGDDYRTHPDYQQFLRRDLTVGSATAGGNLVGTNLLAGSFIELLRHKMVAYQLGAKMLSGLVGNVAIPRQTTAGTAVWETEATGNTSESAQAFDQVSMSPNEVSGYTEISHKLLLQATPGIEGLIQNDLAQVLAIAIDLAIFSGSGGTQPTGISGTSGVGSVNGAGLSWDAIVEFWSDVAAADADAAGMAYVTNPTIGAILKTRPKVAGYPDFLMEKDGSMNGYRVAFTNQIAAGYMYFGDFAQVLVGEWGTLEMQVNPFIKDVEGLIRVIARQAVDVGIRHAGAFSVSSTVS